MYDVGDWFVGVVGYYIQGKNVVMNVGLVIIMLCKVVMIGGVCLFDCMLILLVQWVFYGVNNDVFVGYLFVIGYELVNFYMIYNVIWDIVFMVLIDNFLN